MLSSSGQQSTDQYPEPPACRIGTAAASDIFRLPCSPLSHRYRAGKVGIAGKRGGEGGEDVDLSLGACAKGFLK